MASIAGPLRSLPQGEGARIEMPTDAELAQMPELPIMGMASIEGSWLRGRMSMDLLAVASFMELMESLQD